MNKFIATFIISLFIAAILTAQQLFWRRRADKRKAQTAPFSRISKTDRRAFEEVFSGMNAAETGIEEIVVVNGKQGVSDFVIGVRMQQNRNADYEYIRAMLHRKYYNSIVFVFINLNTVDEMGMFAHGEKIGLRK